VNVCPTIYFFLAFLACTAGPFDYVSELARGTFGLLFLGLWRGGGRAVDQLVPVVASVEIEAQSSGVVFQHKLLQILYCHLQ
jgi:hypothetical protein